MSAAAPRPAPPADMDALRAESAKQTQRATEALDQLRKTKATCPTTRRAARRVLRVAAASLEETEC